MPFSQTFPRSYTADSARRFAPTASGVYGITNSSEWIYIGQSDNIQQSLLGHLGETQGTIVEQSPTGFVFEICDLSARVTRQDRLVLEYTPRCNRFAPRP